MEGPGPPTRRAGRECRCSPRPDSPSPQLPHPQGWPPAPHTDKGGAPPRLRIRQSQGAPPPRAPPTPPRPPLLGRDTSQSALGPALSLSPDGRTLQSHRETQPPPRLDRPRRVRVSYRLHIRRPRGSFCGYLVPLALRAQPEPESGGSSPCCLQMSHLPRRGLALAGGGRLVWRRPPPRPPTLVFAHFGRAGPAGARRRGGRRCCLPHPLSPPRSPSRWLSGWEDQASAPTFGGKGGLGKGPRLEVGQDVAVILWIAGPGVRGRASTRER